MPKSKRAKKPSRAIAKIEKPVLAWGGVMSQPTKPEEVTARGLAVKIAQVYCVPPMGINVMGSQPYLNKDGRLFLLNELRTGKRSVKKIETEFIQISKSPEEYAIVKKTIHFQDGTSVEAIGEANQASVKLADVKKTLNMMAETRALNRAIWQAIAGDVWKRVEQNLKMMTELSPDERDRVMEAGRVSYEEMERPEPPRNEPMQAGRRTPPAPPKQLPQPTTPTQLEGMFRIAAERCTESARLIELDTNLQGSAKYSANFKKEMHAFISSKVDRLDGGRVK